MENIKDNKIKLNINFHRVFDNLYDFIDDNIASPNHA